MTWLGGGMDDEVWCYFFHQIPHAITIPNIQRYVGIQWETAFKRFDDGRCRSFGTKELTSHVVVDSCHTPAGFAELTCPF